MRSALARRLAVQPPGTDPALWRFAGECHGFFARLSGYVGALALIAIVLVSLWDGLQLRDGASAARSGWSVAARAYPAFAVSQSDLIGKTEAYEIFQHPEGGRKDVLRWDADGQAVAELEIYRPGGEFEQPAVARGFGVIDSKFGTVALLGPVGRGGRPDCLGFIKQFNEPELQMSGWSCQGDTVPARRAAIGCMLNRLVLLAAGNDAKLAELFAHAELRRGDCTQGASAPGSADWVTGAQNPQLRGGL